MVTSAMLTNWLAKALAMENPLPTHMHTELQTHIHTHNTHTGSTEGEEVTSIMLTNWLAKALAMHANPGASLWALSAAARVSANDAAYALHGTNCGEQRGFCNLPPPLGSTATTMVWFCSAHCSNNC